MSKFPHIHQPDAMDCGATCLAMITKFYGKNYTVQHLREICYATREPLMKFDIIKFTINYIKMKYAKRKIAYSITTNGTILNDEIIDVLRENHFAVLVSIDGPDNDFNLRHFKNGDKSIDKVLENLNVLKSKGIYLEIRATLINSNPYIRETFDFFENLAIPYSICMAYTSENKEHNLSNYDPNVLNSIKLQFDNLLSYYENRLQKGKPIYNKKFFQTLDILRFRQKKQLACGAGLGYWTITANGNIFTCAHFMNDEKYCVGNVDGIVDALKLNQLKSIPLPKIKKCKNCWIRNLCNGHCLAQKVSLGLGNTDSLPENECDLERIIYEFYIKLFYFAKKYAPQYFIKEEEHENSKLSSQGRRL